MLRSLAVTQAVISCRRPSPAQPPAKTARPTAWRRAGQSGLFTTLPFFQWLLRASGFVEEADRAEQGADSDALSDRVLDAICLIGPINRCRDRIAEYRAAGLDLPILWPGLGVDTARQVIAAFRQ